MIDVKKINSFLQKLNGAEFNYVQNCTSLARRMKNVIEDVGITKEEFCEAMGIPKTQYNKFLSGGWNYDTRHMANFEALHAKKLREIKEAQINEEVKTVRFPPYKHSKPVRNEKS